jgi:hypothetical protein
MGTSFAQLDQTYGHLPARVTSQFVEKTYAEVGRGLRRAQPDCSD